MNKRALIILTGCGLLAPVNATWPQAIQPGVDPEVPPGTETPQGDILLQGKAPQPLVPEIQPGTEAPRAGDTGMAPGTRPLPGTRNSGDEDDIEDLQVERQTVKGGGILQDVPGAGPAAAFPQLPGQPAAGGLGLPASELSTRAPKVAIPADLIAPAAPASRENCGTVLTGLIDDPDSDVNPCPTGCERGEQVWVKTHKSGDTTQYEVSYQCYMPAIPTLAMPADAPSSGENCGTYWTGWMDTLDAGVNPCPQGCLRGQKPSVKTGLSDHGIKYDVNYQCYMPEIPTLSMPADAPSSGENCGTYWTGWMDTLDTDMNPCPEDCVRGQKPTVKTGLSDHGIKYDVNYQCYTATTTMAADARQPKPITDPATTPQPVSSTPAGTLVPASGPWGAFVRVEGAHFGSAETVRGMWFPNDDTTQPPSMTQTVTLYSVEGPDAIKIQIPADPLTSGWSGDFTQGAFRLLLVMPDESVVYAGQYTINSGTMGATPRPDELTPTIASAPTEKRMAQLVDDVPAPGNRSVVPQASGEIPSLGSTTSSERSPDQSNLETLSERPYVAYLNATAILSSPESALVRWRDQNPSLGKNYVYISEGEADQFRLLNPDGKTNWDEENRWRSLTVDQLRANQIYKFRVERRYENGGSDFGETSFDTTPSNAPAWISAVVEGLSIRLIWPAVMDYIEQFNEPGSLVYAKSCCERFAYLLTVSSENEVRTRSLLIKPSAEYDVTTRYFRNSIRPFIPTHFLNENGIPKGPVRWTTLYASPIAATLRYSLGTHVDGYAATPIARQVTSDPVRIYSAYRVSVIGIEAIQETQDDSWERDGKRDEVQITARVCIYDRCSIVASPVFGDTNGQEARRQAGSASPLGGIRSGDYIGLRAMESGTATETGFPFVLWEGRLDYTSDSPHLTITPVLWEWDNQGRDTQSGAFFGFDRPGQIVEAGGFGFGTYRMSNAGTCYTYSTGVDPIGTETRAIGVVQSPDGSSPGRYVSPCRVLALTRDSIEEGLGALTNQVISLDLNDALSGHYTMYFKIERLP